MSEKKIAIVTGASRGIGKAIALELARQGIFVVINYNGSKEKAEEALRTIQNEGGDGVIYQCNVADFEACKTFIEDIVSTYGRIDILVNNAGITKDGLLMRMSEADFSERNVPLYSSCGTSNVEAEIRKDHQSCIGSCFTRKCRTGKLRGIKSRNYRYDKICGKRACIQTYYSQCNCAGIYSDRYDSGTF